MEYFRDVLGLCLTMLRGQAGGFGWAPY